MVQHYFWEQQVLYKLKEKSKGQSNLSSPPPHTHASLSLNVNVVLSFDVYPELACKCLYDNTFILQAAL